MGFADLHLHSTYSHDGTCSIEAILMKAEQRHLDVIAITDHNSMKGVQEAISKADRYHLQVIPAMEISTAQGHVLAYEIMEPVPRGLSFKESVLQVHSMGGFCIIPHPMVLGSDGIRQHVLTKALKNPDIAKTILGIELINGGLFRRNHHAQGLERKLTLAPIGSSDGHNINSIGRITTEFTGTTIKDLKKCLCQRTTTAVRQSPVFDPLFYLQHLFYRILRKIGYGIDIDTKKQFLRLKKISGNRGFNAN